MLRQQRGFTLIELLVVIAIIGLLASIVLVSLNSARTKARDARRIADLGQIKNALELYMQDNKVYPGQCATYYWVDDNNYAGGTPCVVSGGLAPYFSGSICNIHGPKGEGGVDGYAYTPKLNGTAYKLGARFEQSQNQGAPFTYGCTTQTTRANWYESK